jgi:hypothetical protein
MTLVSRRDDDSDVSETRQQSACHYDVLYTLLIWLEHINLFHISQINVQTATFYACLFMIKCWIVVAFYDCSSTMVLCYILQTCSPFHVY